MKDENKPRGAWLRNGNPPLDLRTLPRCGAKTRAGHACRQPAMKNGRCRFHGGKSTGPKTQRGKERSRMNALRTGQHTAEARAKRKAEREEFRILKAFCEETLDLFFTIFQEE